VLSDGTEQPVIGRAGERDGRIAEQQEASEASVEAISKDRERPFAW
jgi:hypothetical protein